MRIVQIIDRFYLVIPKNKKIRHLIIVLETMAISLVSNGVRKRIICFSFFGELLGIFQKN
jgi:hypothetical protein